MDLNREVSALSEQFGLTPSSQIRLGISAQQQPEAEVDIFAPRERTNKPPGKAAAEPAKKS